MFAYRLSVVGSVAPPGTAWDAEGLRGNEANENNLMVLARLQARKWQSGLVLHKRTLPVVRASGFGLPKAALTHRWRLRGPTAEPASRKWLPCRFQGEGCHRWRGQPPTLRFHAPA